MECEFCKKTFYSKSNLTAHQKTAIYCLKLQGENLNEKFICEYCNKVLTQQKSLDVHSVSCKEKKKKNEMMKESEKSLIIKKLEYEILNLKKNEMMKESDKSLIKKLEYEILNLNRNDKYNLQKISEKNQYISKLEAKLDKRDTQIECLMEKIEKISLDSIMSMVKEKEKDKEKDDIEFEYENIIPIALGEKIQNIIIEEIKEDEVEYSNITLNNIIISSRPIDHYVNATQLCQAGGKKFSHWFSLDTTKELINELSADAGIPASGLVDTKRGGNNKSAQGSWIHPDLSIQLAQWISPKFSIQVSKWIRTLFTNGSLEIDVNLLREKDRDIRAKDNRIKQLESVCLSKQRRVEYPERNVIYMLTTEDHLHRRTYIIGKAKNLTNRLSTYNKTCDHTVVHYRECKNEEDMDTAEIMVLNKLKDYREQANRDRFILPEDKDEKFFINIIDDCISFI